MPPPRHEDNICSCRELNAARPILCELNAPSWCHFNVILKKLSHCQLFVNFEFTLHLFNRSYALPDLKMTAWYCVLRYDPNTRFVILLCFSVVYIMYGLEHVLMMSPFSFQLDTPEDNADLVDFTTSNWLRFWKLGAMFSGILR